MAISSELKQAEEAIASLYTKNLFTHLSGKRVHGNRLIIPTPQWTTLAKKNPSFQVSISELGLAVVKAESDRDNTGGIPQSEIIRQTYFGSFTQGADNKLGQYLLTDILNHRVRTSHADPIASSYSPEAHRLLVEYGLPEGLLSPPSKSLIAFRTIISKVLTEEIYLTTQTPRRYF